MKTSKQVNDNTTIRELVSRYPQTRSVFEERGIDYCCGGSKRLADAASDTQTNVVGLLAALETAIETPANCASTATNWSEAPLHELVAHILKVHHAYVREALPKIGGLLRKVQHAHGAEHGEMLRGLQSQFTLLENELTGHMMKEEMILFPYVVGAEAHRQGAGQPPSNCFGTVCNPIRQMEAEHEVAGEALRQMRKLTGGYTLPSDACPTFHALYEELERLEKDLHEHIHLENNILFPRAIEAESTLPDNLSSSCSAVLK
jgi:regulator of cell morphogenesis and NO signaling